MGKSLNRVTLIGHLGKDPELSYTTSGIAKCAFSVATTEQWLNDAKEKQEKTEWHNIVVWRKLAEVCGQYLKKGSKVYLEGKLTTRSWDDTKSNTKKYITEIVLEDLVMLDSKSGVEKAAEQESVGTQEPQPDNNGGQVKDDLPF